MSRRAWNVLTGLLGAFAVAALIPHAPIWQRVIASALLVAAILAANEGHA